VHVGFGLLTLFPGRVGGSETYVRGLLDQFREGNGPERVTVLANRPVAGAYGPLADGRIGLHRVRTYPAGNRDVTRALGMAVGLLAPRIVRRDVPPGLDVLHLPVTVPIPQLELPTAVTIHEVQHRVVPELFSWAERRYRRRAYDESARRADVVIAVSSYVGERLIELVGVAPGRVEVVHLGIDHDIFQPEPEPGDEERVRRFELPERFVLYPANLWGHKNHRRLIEGLGRSTDGELALVLAGQDYGRLDELMRWASAAGLQDRVQHLGHVDGPTLAALYRRAHGMVYPSLHEGFGAPPLEAMACGCPVASALNTSLAEVCGDAVIGMDPQDPDSISEAITRLIGDGQLRSRLRQAGLRRAATFTWEAAAERHTAIYGRLAATRGAGGA
jgi:glycosyltransferase involved in cell wall biosynthesis